MVEDTVEEDPDPARLRLRDETVEVGLRPEVSFLKLTTDASGQLTTSSFLDRELEVLRIETPSWEHTRSGAGTEAECFRRLMTCFTP